MSFEEFPIPKSFVEKRAQSINVVLDYLSTLNIILFGAGIDVGPFAASSVGILEPRGLKVTYVEKDPRCIPSILRQGGHAVNKDVMDFLPSLTKLDFITFFGAPKHFPIKEMLKIVIPKLSEGGVALVTGYPSIESDINQALVLGGQKIIFVNTHDWDSIGYVFQK